MVNRRRREMGVHQLDASPIGHLELVVRGDEHGPTKMMGDTDMHALSLRFVRSSGCCGRGATPASVG